MEVNERILERIAGLEKIIPPALVEQALARTSKQSTRVCTLNSELKLAEWFAAVAWEIKKRAAKALASENLF